MRAQYEIDTDLERLVPGVEVGMEMGDVLELILMELERLNEEIERLKVMQ